MKVKLHPAESLLNKLTHAERKRSGSLLQRQKAGFDILCEALAQAKAKGAAEEREACAKLAESMCRCADYWKPYGRVDPACGAHDTASAILDRGGKP